MNKISRILIDNILEVDIGPKVTVLGKRRTFVVSKSNLGGGDMKVATANIRIVKLHTTEPLCPTTACDIGERAAAATTTDTGDTTITYPVSVQVFEVPAREPLNDEAFRMVVAHPMAETPRRPLSTLTESVRSVVWGRFTPCDRCIY